jgi:hypothetical protein
MLSAHKDLARRLDDLERKYEEHSQHRGCPWES